MQKTLFLQVGVAKSPRSQFGHRAESIRSCLFFDRQKGRSRCGVNSQIWLRIVGAHGFALFSQGGSAESIRSQRGVNSRRSHIWLVFTGQRVVPAPSGSTRSVLARRVGRLIGRGPRRFECINTWWGFLSDLFPSAKFAFFFPGTRPFGVAQPRVMTQSTHPLPTGAHSGAQKGRALPDGEGTIRLGVRAVVRGSAIQCSTSRVPVEICTASTVTQAALQI